MIITIIITTIVTIIFTGTQVDTLPDGILEARLSACRALVAIAKRVPELPMDHITKRVLELVPRVSEREKIELFEFLVLASRAHSTDTQGRYVSEMLREPLGQWTSPDLGHLLANPASVLHLVGMSEQEQRELYEHQGSESLGPTSVSRITRQYTTNTS
jgi:hypothetical protein